MYDSDVKKSSTKKEPYKYSIRLSPELGDRVNDLSDRLRIEPTQTFSEALIEKFSEGNDEQILQRVDGLESEIKKLRMDLAKATKVLLILVGTNGSMRKEEAEKFVANNMMGGM